MGCIITKIDNELINSDYKIEHLNIKSQYGKVVEIYDAHNIKINIKFNGILYKEHCKLNGIRDDEIDYISKKKLIKLTTSLDDNKIQFFIMNQSNILPYHDRLIYVRTNGRDKYGRTLVTLFTDKESIISINQQLISIY